MSGFFVALFYEWTEFRSGGQWLLKIGSAGLVVQLSSNLVTHGQ